MKNIFLVKWAYVWPYVFFVFWLMSIPGQLWPQAMKPNFLFPIRTNRPVSLTGNFAELRSNHYHGGLDIRTNFTTGLKVLAADEGYVSYISVQPDGYGNMLWVTHPGGYVTLYAHLDRFRYDIQKYIRDHQYATESWQAGVVPPPGLLKVKKGDTIAISGNTGSSKGPHLHFEIRDTANMMYNPLTMGFAEVQDIHAPIIDAIGIKPLGLQSRVEGEYKKLVLTPAKHENGYHIKQPIRAQGMVALELMARDQITNGSMNAAIFCYELYVDGEMIFYHNYAKVHFNHSIHVNQFKDFAEYRKTGRKFQKLYAADGLYFSELLPQHRKGRIFIKAGEQKQVLLKLFDAHGNSTSCTFTLLGDTSHTKQPLLINPLAKTSASHAIDENILIVKVKHAKTERGTFYFRKDTVSVNKAYVSENNSIFLWDLRKNLPDSFRAGDFVYKFQFKGTVVPGRNQKFILNSNYEIYFNDQSLFDTLYLEAVEDTLKQIMRIGNANVPLKGHVIIKKKNVKPCRTAQGLYAETSLDEFNKYTGGNCQNGTIEVKTKYLGNFKERIDSIAPVIKPLALNKNGVRIEIYDNLSGIHSFKANIGGKFLLLLWDKKNHLLYTDPDDRNIPLSGQFELTVKDNAGNESYFTRLIP